MRSAQLFRNDKVKRLFRPFWDSSRSPKAGVKSVSKETQPSPDPYEGNFSFIECDQYTKVTVIGAAGRVGKTLSLLLKTCPLIDHLCLFDTDKSVKGVGVDISHIDTKCSVSYICGMRNIQQALDAPDVVIISAGCPAAPGLNGKKLFDKNAPIVAGLSEACARFCPKACIVLITSPINSLLPVVGEVYHVINNRIPSRRLFGLTTLDVVRANTFVAEVVRKDPNNIIVPVIGGTSQETIVPVISQMKPAYKIKRGEMLALTECLKRAEENLSDCQHCGTRGASTLSTAYAGFRFTTSLIMALKGAENIVECAFVKSDIIPELEYLASPLKLGIRGIEYNYGYPPLSDYELAGLQHSAAVLKLDIEMGKSFVGGIEDTIQKGLIWKRISMENGAAVRSSKSQARRRRSADGAKEETKDVIPVTREVYTEGVRNWRGRSFLSKIFGGREEQGGCNEISTDSIPDDRGESEATSAVPLLMYLDAEPEDILDFDTTEVNYPLPTPWKRKLFQTENKTTQTVRGFHTIRKESQLEERPLRRKTQQDEYKRYLMEDRQKTLIPVSTIKPPIEPVFKPKFRKVQKSLRKPHKPYTIPGNQYKDLNAAAKQKFRSFNSQKKFTPSASVLLLLDKKKKERAGKNLGLFMTQRKQELGEGEEKKEGSEIKVEVLEEKDDAIIKETKPEEQNKLMVRTEKDEITKYKDFIFKQLRQLKKENEELKQRLAEISQDKTLETALQVQSESLELERTKLKACWLIMSSTMDAFSNFCRKFTSKTDEQLLEAAREIEKQKQCNQQKEAEESEEEEFDDAVESLDTPVEKKDNSREKKYFQFLEKLMEDQMESRFEKEVKQKNRMKK